MSDEEFDESVLPIFGDESAEAPEVEWTFADEPATVSPSPERPSDEFLRMFESDPIEETLMKIAIHLEAVREDIENCRTAKAEDVPIYKAIVWGRFDAILRLARHGRAAYHQEFKDGII